MGSGIIVRKADNSNFAVSDDVNTNEVISVVNNAFAFTIHDARISSSSRTEIEQKNYVGTNSTIVRMIKQRDGDLSTKIDIIDVNETGFIRSSLKQTSINKHTEANRGVLRKHLPLE